MKGMNPRNPRGYKSDSSFTCSRMIQMVQPYEGYALWTLVVVCTMVSHWHICEAHAFTWLAITAISSDADIDVVDPVDVRSQRRCSCQ